MSEWKKERSTKHKFGHPKRFELSDNFYQGLWPSLAWISNGLTELEAFTGRMKENPPNNNWKTLSWLQKLGILAKGDVT